MRPNRGRMISVPETGADAAARWVKLLRPLFVAIRTASALLLFLPATIQAQGPFTSIAGHQELSNRNRQVWNTEQITKNTYSAADLVRIAANGSGGTAASPCGRAGDATPSASPKPLSAAAECSLKPKDVFKECDKCPEMIVVPAGDFIMGSPDDEPDRNKNEGPRHKVVFARPFAVGRFAVTFDEWDACVAAGGCNHFQPDDQAWGRGNRPVIHVSWDDAQAYVAWLSHATGKTYRLLTEAEREYITRAGTTTPFWFGSTISLKEANFDGKHPYNNGPMGAGRGKTLPVDEFQPNPWGLYQVHGNVWDWVQDCFNASYVGAPADGSAWMSGDCSKHMLRGGSWIDQPRFLRSAFRLADFTPRRYDLQGFRVARSLGP